MLIRVAVEMDVEVDPTDLSQSALGLVRLESSDGGAVPFGAEVGVVEDPVNAMMFHWREASITDFKARLPEGAQIVSWTPRVQVL